MTSSNEYHFITRWRVQGRVEGVADVLSDAEDLARWWPLCSSPALPAAAETERAPHSPLGESLWNLHLSLKAASRCRRS